MSARRLLIWVVASISWLLIYGSAYAILDWLRYKEDSERMKTLIPLAVAVPTAALAGAFARRNSHLQGLRELWRYLIPAAQSAIQYTYLVNPDQAAFSKTQESLSTATDLLRGVFCNVPSKGALIGLFPFENIKDIQKIISWLGYGESFRSKSATVARKCITRLWQEMHVAMLSEFDRDIPVSPISKYFNDGVSVADLLIGGTLEPHHLDRERQPSAPNSAS